jgi:hypothetical protein
MTALAASLEIITAPVLGEVRHGFFTRRGGASSGIFEGLNCGRGSSDQVRQAVDEPNARAPMRWFRAGQAGDGASGPFRDVAPSGRRVSADGTRTADAMVTDMPGLALVGADGRLPARAVRRRRGRGDRCRPCRLARRARRGARGDARRDGRARAPTAQHDRRRDRPHDQPDAPTRSGPEFFERFLDDDAGNGRFFAQGQGDRVQFDLPAYSASPGCARRGWRG